MAPMLGPDGAPLAARGWYDTESIAEDGGTLYVGIERVHQIVRFNYGKDGLLARGYPIALPHAARLLPSNQGFEALVFIPQGLHLAGTLVAISERGLDKAGNIKAFLIGGSAPGGFTVKRSADYDISDAALLPTGDLLLLERKFHWSTGLGVRMRRIALPDVTAGALVNGAVLLDADHRYEIDNMYGRVERPLRRWWRDHIDDDLRRQFLDGPADFVTAVRAAGAVMKAYAAPAGCVFCPRALRIRRLSSSAFFDRSASLAFIRNVSSPPR
jgi:hypothetical protein